MASAPKVEDAVRGRRRRCHLRSGRHVPLRHARSKPRLHQPASLTRRSTCNRSPWREGDDRRSWTGELSSRGGGGGVAMYLMAWPLLTGCVCWSRRSQQSQQRHDPKSTAEAALRAQKPCWSRSSWSQGQRLSHSR